MNKNANPTFLTDTRDPAALSLKTVCAALLSIIACSAAFSVAFISPIALSLYLWPKAMPIVTTVEIILFALGQPLLFDAFDDVERRVIRHMAEKKGMGKKAVPKDRP